MRIKLVFILLWFSLVSFHLPRLQAWQEEKQTRWFQAFLAKSNELSLPLHYKDIDNIERYIGHLDSYAWNFHYEINANRKIEHIKFPISLPSEPQKVVTKDPYIRTFTPFPRLPIHPIFLGSLKKQSKNPIIVYAEGQGQKIIKFAIFNKKGKCLKIQPFGMASGCRRIDATLFEDMSIKYTSSSCKIEVDTNGVHTGKTFDYFVLDSATVQLLKIPKNEK